MKLGEKDVHIQLKKAIKFIVIGNFYRIVWYEILF